MSIQLQERDLKIFKFIYTYRVASYSQIQSRFFANCFRTVAPRRINKLVSHGFLQSFIMGEDFDVYQFVRLTDRGWQQIRESWSCEIDHPLLKSESPIHDLHLAEVAPAFERLSTFKSLITENLLSSSKAVADEEKLSALAKLHADGALLLEPPSSPIYTYGIEIELSKKAPDRYREKLMNYYLANDIDGVLYISNSQSILDALARVDTEVRSSRTSILHLALEKNVLSSNGRIHFQKADGGAIELF